MTERGSLPLQGIRVIDLTVENGELAPRLLADLGADVIKIEPPDGSPARSLAPIRRGVSLSWAVNNAGKRSVVLDLETPEGRERLHTLAAHSDLIVCPTETIAPGLSVHDLAAAHQHLIVAALTPYGLTGPWSHWQVTDQVLSATGGMTFKAGTLDREPIPAPGQFSNDVAASSATWAMLCAIWQREHTGAGQLLDISINECLAQPADWSLPN